MELFLVVRMDRLKAPQMVAKKVVWMDKATVQHSEAMLDASPERLWVAEKECGAAATTAVKKVGTKAELWEYQSVDYSAARTVAQWECALELPLVE